MYMVLGILLSEVLQEAPPDLVPAIAFSLGQVTDPIVSSTHLWIRVVSGDSFPTITVGASQS